MPESSYLQKAALYARTKLAEVSASPHLVVIVIFAFLVILIIIFLNVDMQPRFMDSVPRVEGMTAERPYSEPQSAQDIYAVPSDTVAVVLVYDKFCGHCNNFAGTWMVLSRQIAEEFPSVKLFAVGNSNDAARQTIVQRENVAGYPTVLIRDASSYPEFIEYAGPRTIRELKAAITANLPKLEEEES